jgi:hypothetical protein
MEPVGVAGLLGQITPVRQSGKPAPSVLNGNAAPAAIARAFTPAMAQAPEGFVNLVNLLLGSPNADRAAGAASEAFAASPAAASPAAAGSTAAGNDVQSTPPPILTLPSQPMETPVSASQLADAMIRSMFTSAGNVASLTVSGAGASGASTGPTVPVRAARSSNPQSDSNSQLAGTVPSAPVASIPLQIQSGIAPSTVRGTGAQTIGAGSTATRAAGPKLPLGALPAGTATIPAASELMPSPLAFGLRMTPIAEPVIPESPIPAAKQSAPAAQATPIDPELSATAAEMEPEPVAAPEVRTEDPKPAAASTVEGVDAKAGQHGEAVAIVAAASAVAVGGDGSNDFARQMSAVVPNAVAVAGDKAQGSSGSFAGASAAPSAEQALRASEPSAPAAPAQTAAAVKEIAVRIATPQAPAVDVRLVERAGQLQVSVRTSDGGLQTSLRQDLGSLVNSLERSGYRAETFLPRETPLAAAISAQISSQNGRQQSEAGSGGRNGNPADTSQDSGGQQQQKRHPRQSKWVEEDVD